MARVGHSCPRPPSLTLSVAQTPLLFFSALPHFRPYPSQAGPTLQFKFLGIDTLTGNITNTTEPELPALFAPFDTIIACTGMTYPPGTQLILTRAILASPTRPYFPWQFGVDYDIIGRGSSQDLLSEQLCGGQPLRQQTGIDWVIVSTGLFMSFCSF